MSNRVIVAIKRMDKSLEPICKKYGKSKMFFWVDAFFARLKYGLTPSDYIELEFYKLRGIERKEYYVARHKIKFEKLLNSAETADIFWKKQEFNKAFSDFVKRDWLYTPDATVEEIEEFLNKHPRVIVKPAALYGGTGIHIYNGEPAEQLKAEKCLLEEVIVQHSKMSSLNDTSVNTIRVYTILDRENTPHMISAALRVGRKGAEVDNFHSGGVSYPVDEKYGVVSGAGYNLACERFIYHPGTETKVVGFEIPNWNELKEFVFSAAKLFPQARLIAWDAVVLEDGFELIEANYSGCLRVMQEPMREGKLKFIKKYM